MTITDIRVRKVLSQDRLKAIVSITIDDVLAIHEIKVIQGEKRLFVAMPSRKDETGVFRDIIHPIYPETRKSLEEQILDAYVRYTETAEAEEETF